jgi:signal peptidase I
MGKLVRFVLWISILGGAVVGLLRLTAIRWWRVPMDDPILGASITPTIRPGDLIVLWRATPPRFGSLVLCPDPEDPAHLVVGRIVGEAGDTVTIDGDNVSVNGHRAQTEFVCDEATFKVEDPNTGAQVEQRCQVEAIGGVSHQRGGILGDSPALQVSQREVGEGRVFLLSDNRLYPFDSRHYGAVLLEGCKESIFFRLVSRAGFLDMENRFTYIR